MAARSAASWERAGSRHGSADGVGLEVGQAVDGDRAVPVLDHHRGADVLPAGAQVDAGGVGQLGELNPSRMAESWLPLVTTTRARRPASRARVVEKSSTASTGRQGPVVDVPGRRAPGRPARLATVSTRWSR